MRLLIVAASIAVVMAASPSIAQARTLAKAEVQVCKWGSDVAASAQRAKLSGRTLYITRLAISKHRYPQPWMGKMAIGITEQTFKSRSTAKPDAVGQSYYRGCIAHEKKAPRRG